MPDLLTHVLVGYSLVALAAAVDGPGVGRIEPRHVGVGMVGAATPDLSKVGWAVPAGTTEALVGVPLSFTALHTLGGVLALAGVVALLFGRDERPAVFAVYASMGTVHLALDTLITRAGGYAPPYLYPLTWWQPPAGGVFVSSDLAPLLVAAPAAVAVWWATRGRRRDRPTGGSG